MVCPLNAIRIQLDAGEDIIPVDDVERVEIRNAKYGKLQGALVGVAVDAFVVIVAATSSMNMGAGGTVYTSGGY